MGLGRELRKKRAVVVVVAAESQCLRTLLEQLGEERVGRSIRWKEMRFDWIEIDRIVQVDLRSVERLEEEEGARDRSSAQVWERRRLTMKGPRKR
jgi:hypothetical protein